MADASDDTDSGHLTVNILLAVPAETSTDESRQPLDDAFVILALEFADSSAMLRIQAASDDLDLGHLPRDEQFGDECITAAWVGDPSWMLDGGGWVSMADWCEVSDDDRLALAVVVEAELEPSLAGSLSLYSRHTCSTAANKR